MGSSRFGRLGLLASSLLLAASVAVATDARPAVAAAAKLVTRLSGTDRIATAIAVSQDEFPTMGAASAVVLTQGSGSFADALAGTPLAVAKGGPLLLNPTGALDSRVKTEIQRVLPGGKTVYLLGGPAALDPSIDAALRALGYDVVRYGGLTRYETAAIVADQGLGGPDNVLEATGLDFPDALAAGAAAANANAAVLLTAGTTSAPATMAYLLAHPPKARWAVGGPAAAADPMATAIVGTDRFDTAAKVAVTFFDAPTLVGAADGLAFADALSGGAHVGRFHGPLLLVRPATPLPDATASYLAARKSSINSAYVYGGPAAVGGAVLTALQSAIS